MCSINLSKAWHVHCLVSSQLIRTRTIILLSPKLMLYSWCTSVEVVSSMTMNNIFCHCSIFHWTCVQANSFRRDLWLWRRWETIAGCPDKCFLKSFSGSSHENYLTLHLVAHFLYAWISMCKLVNTKNRSSDTVL